MDQAEESTVPPRKIIQKGCVHLLQPLATPWQHIIVVFIKFLSRCFELLYPSIQTVMAPACETKVYQGSPKASREGGEWEGGGKEEWLENSAKKTAGLEPIRPGEAPSTCTTRPPGRVPVTR